MQITRTMVAKVVAKYAIGGFITDLTGAMEFGDTLISIGMTFDSGTEAADFVACALWHDFIAE